MHTLEIDYRIKGTATDLDLAPYMIANGIPNQASLRFGDGSSIVYSEIPTVILPVHLTGISKKCK